MSNLWIDGRKFYLFDEYDSKEEAIKVAKQLKKMYTIKTFIRLERGGTFVPEVYWSLYTNKPL